MMMRNEAAKVKKMTSHRVQRHFVAALTHRTCIVFCSITAVFLTESYYFVEARQPTKTLASEKVDPSVKESELSTKDPDTTDGSNILWHEQESRKLQVGGCCSWDLKTCDIAETKCNSKEQSCLNGKCKGLEYIDWSRSDTSCIARGDVCTSSQECCGIGLCRLFPNNGYTCGVEGDGPVMPDPTPFPTENPVQPPTTSPTSIPSITHTSSPSLSPTESLIPSTSPSSSPSKSPVESPTSPPSDSSSSHPSVSPANSSRPSNSPTLVTYEPGFLRPADSRGIRWSRGLQARLIAQEGQGVLLNGGPTRSSAIFHTDVDAGACFETSDGGWVYASNSEDKWSTTYLNRGGVGAIYFDSSGNIKDYQWILSKTNDNCGGGKSPWDTWITCEEDGAVGGVFEVDPLGPYGNTLLDSNHRYGRRTCMGQGGGNFESAAYDGRQLDEDLCRGDVLSKCVVDFFITHDADRGEVRKYTPKASVVRNGYLTDNMLSILEDDTPSGQAQYSNCVNKREGAIEYLKITTGSGGASGSFAWTTSKTEGQDSAQLNYPYNEGVDVKDGRLYIVSKTRKLLFTFDLDAMTWTRTSTNSGLFAHQPDQIKFITGDTDSGLLYFTEDGGANCGVHAQTPNGEYLTIFESDGTYYNTETTGLAFSPDKKRMYCAFQGRGHLYEIVREDGLPFDGVSLDVNYHAVTARRERRQMLLRG